MKNRVPGVPETARMFPGTGMGQQVQHGGRRPASLADKVNLAIALTFLAIFLVAAYYSTDDEGYAGVARATAAAPSADVRVDGGVIGVSAHRAVDTILVVENDSSQRLVAKTTLEHFGYNVALAYDEAQALSLLRAAAPRVSLVLLGRTDLLAAGHAIREFQQIQPGVPVLVGGPQGKSAQLGSGARGWVERPFQPMPLAAAV